MADALSAIEENDASLAIRFGDVASGSMRLTSAQMRDISDQQLFLMVTTHGRKTESARSFARRP
ncbi:MAG: hypothetical protein R3D44_02800 [Hyphomicrobiaceae bacterium]